jgi:hypothetical protein
MDTAITNRIPQMRHVHLDLCIRPLQRLCKILDRPRKHALAHIPLHELAQQFEPRIARPAVHRNRKHLLMHIHKTRLLEPVLEFIRNAQRPPEAHGGLVLRAMPLQQFVGGGHGAVVAVEFCVEFVGLEEAAGLEVVVGFLDDGAEVGVYAEGHARVDVVVGLGAVPPFFAPDVVDEEVDVVGGAVAGG